MNEFSSRHRVTPITGEISFRQRAKDDCANGQKTNESTSRKRIRQRAGNK